MSPDSGGPVDKIIETLRERAKELHCLYEVHELTADPQRPPDEVCRSLLEVIPPGWQYPQFCFARITLDTTVFEPPRVAETEWVQRSHIVVQGEVVGAIEVFYMRPMPKADEGPFLKEERKLIDTIAERMGHYLMQRRLQASLMNWQSAIENLDHEDRREWWVIIEFLRKTDARLLSRISRRMINYLCWNGVDEAQDLLLRFSADMKGAQNDENRPIERRNGQDVALMTDATFKMAAAHLSEREIVDVIEKWIKEDKSGFLVEAAENQCTSLSDISEALERYSRMGLDDHDLTRAVQLGLRASLARRFLSEDLDFINTAKHYLEVDDFCGLVTHIIAPNASHGKLGGKSAGLLLATHIVRKSKEYADAVGNIKVPKTWYLSSDGVLNFVEFNHLEDVYNRKYLEADQIRREYPHIVEVFKHSTFSPDILKGLSVALDDFEGRPLIVRSSSLLEDRMGAAFSGKYKSLFLANQGAKAERLAALTDAIAEVYASVFGPDPIEYRAERGLLDLHEEMGVMIQEVVGTRVGRYFMPAFAGVAFSNNEFRWSARIKREDGLVRMVPGLGTRAVDRLTDDYPVLIAPGQPGLRVNVTVDETLRYSPKKIDVINLESNRFETVRVADVAAEYGREYPLFGQLFSLCNEDGVRPPVGLLDPETMRNHLVVTFEGLISSTPFITQMRALLRLLQEKIGGPVDIEFASDGRDFYLLQCRPQSFSDDAAPAPIPRDIPANRVIFTANRYVSNGRVPDVTHIVYVDPEQYNEVADLGTLRAIGRAVGRLNKLLPKHQFVLIGPGRWGSRGDIKLGVSVTYSDISNTAVLMEIGMKRGNYMPDLSFGTHFFQDLVESGIRYLPLFPGEPHTAFNTSFLRHAPNILADMTPDYAHLAHVIKVIDIPRTTDGLVLRILMNADLDEAIGMLDMPQPTTTIRVPTDRRRGPEKAPEDHWRWRLRMAERIAAELDPARFGVKALYVFGSTKNATAGPGSDIDLLVHFEGTDEMRRSLQLWLDGWSLCLSEMNFLRSGYQTDGLLDVHIVTDEDIARQTSFASKINAVTDPARPLPIGTGVVAQS